MSCRRLARGGIAWVGQLQLSQPVLTFVWSALLLGEHLTVVAVGTALLILVCVVITQRTRAADGAAAVTQRTRSKAKPDGRWLTGRMGVIILVRHGETEWSAAHRHTSYTDLDLTPNGERQAGALAGALARRSFVAVLCSPRRRARRTADLAGLAVTTIDEDLVEWNYGAYEGLTTADIRTERPGWDLWTDGCPGGERPDQVAARLDRAIERAAALLDRGDVALVAHGHSLRVTAARWIGLPAAGGGRLRLDTATLSTLGYERERRVIRRWNAPVDG